MTKILCPLAAAAAATLALAGAASAKEISSLEICGASDCTTVDDRAVLAHVGEGSNGEGGGGAPPAASPYYKLTYTVTAGAGESFENGRRSFTRSAYYVPRAGMMRFVNGSGPGVTWSSVTPEFRRFVRERVQGVAPVPPPRVTQALVGSKRAKDPQSYLEVFSVASQGDAVLEDADWVSIKLRSTRPSPWTDGANTIQYSPSAKVLDRDGFFVRLPGGLAAQLENKAPLRTPSEAFPWPILVGALLGAAALVGGAVAIRFLRRPQAPPTGEPRTA